MRSQSEINEIISLLETDYPEAGCSLDYIVPHEMLFSIRLAAQCTDERVNKITPVLFSHYPSLEAVAAADITDVEEIVRPCGYYRAKARDIVLCAKMLIDECSGVLPDSMEELLKLPGVGRKTANLILGDIYGQSAVVVDTHCIRLSNRLGLVENLKDPTKIERKLREILPAEKSNDFCHRLVFHGRAVCTARRPNCFGCSLINLCPSATAM